MNGWDEIRKPLETTGREPMFFYSLPALAERRAADLAPLPYVVRILLESVVRRQRHPAFQEHHAAGLLGWRPQADAGAEFPFCPARVLLQDFTGVPCVADLAALRDAVAAAGRDPRQVEPLIPVDLVIDHSVQIDEFGRAQALDANQALEFERNRERYSFLRWGQGAFRRLTIIPPGLGICHQINLEYLARMVLAEPDADGRTVLYPDTVVGTDSHTTMINGMGILGWGVGGIEAEAAMLNQPIPLLTPQVTGVRLVNRLPAGVTATDLALHLTQLLRAARVVGQLVEFCGPGLDHLTLSERATVANMAPEYGATTGYFPVDTETLRYLRETGRPEEHVHLVEAYYRAQQLFRDGRSAEPQFTRVLEVDLATLEPVVAGPRKPHERLTLGQVKPTLRRLLTAPAVEQGYGLAADAIPAPGTVPDRRTPGHGSIVLASITSCTNTSNPHVLLLAGLLARNAVQRGLTVPPFVKTSLAPGSRVVTAYLRKAGLLEPLERLGFHVAAYGCATCIGNSGPLTPEAEAAVRQRDLVVAAVLSGNRNFEGRVHPLVKANFLCSPPLVVAYALAGTTLLDLAQDPLGTDVQGRPVFLRELWPADDEVRRLLSLAAAPELYREMYEHAIRQHPTWNNITAEPAAVYPWQAASTYIRRPPFLDDVGSRPPALRDITGARILGLFGDFITTDHISPAGAIAKDSPAAEWLAAHGVAPAAFSSYGARRGNHEVMMRGTFANPRLRNMLTAQEGGWTRFFPGGEPMRIYPAAMKYAEAGTPLVVVGGKMYGAGSSRDWAAKGVALLGVKAVLAESFERIHRSNLVEMGVLPLEFRSGANAARLGLDGSETLSINGLAGGLTPGATLQIRAERTGWTQSFAVTCRMDSAIEAEYFRHGGILPYMLRRLRDGTT